MNFNTRTTIELNRFSTTSLFGLASAHSADGSVLQSLPSAVAQCSDTEHRPSEMDINPYAKWSQIIIVIDAEYSREHIFHSEYWECTMHDGHQECQMVLITRMCMRVSGWWCVDIKTHTDGCWVHILDPIHVQMGSLIMVRLCLSSKSSKCVFLSILEKLCRC